MRSRGHTPPGVQQKEVGHIHINVQFPLNAHLIVSMHQVVSHANLTLGQLPIPISFSPEFGEMHIIAGCG